jgi:hypothetical protein
MKRASAYVVATLVAARGGRENSTTNAESGTTTDGPLPACSWPTPVLPPDSGPVQIAADRTVLLCAVPIGGKGEVSYFNPTICLSASATECTPVGFYDDGGGPPCVSSCSTCMAMCAPNEYAIGVGRPESPEGPLVPLPSAIPPPNCLGPPIGGLAPWMGGPEPSVWWNYWCCPCE